MRYTLENDILRVEIDSFGAELKSVKSKATGQEYMWQADPEFWGRTSPVLFPFVGKVVGGKYRIEDKEYEMKTQHGFARDMEFEFVEADANHVVHRLLPNDNTRKIYPYEFELLVTHELDEANPRLLNIKWDVKNNSEETMYYFIDKIEATR